MSIYRATSKKLYYLKDTLKNIVKSKCTKNVEVTYSKTRRRKQRNENTENEEMADLSQYFD